MSTWFRRFKRWYRRPFKRRLLLRAPRREVPPEEVAQARVSVLLPTFNRLPYLREGLLSLLAATGPRTEILVWDNASTDGTRAWLEALAPRVPRLRVFLHGENIGINALAACAREAGGDFLLQVDDDVLHFPPGLVRDMLRIYLSLPILGYLGADVHADRFTDGGRLPERRSVRVAYPGGPTLDFGPVGGWCTLTDRRLYDAVGGFLERPGETYFWADADYSRKIRARGRQRGIALGLKIYHAFRVALREEDVRAYDATRALRDPTLRFAAPAVDPDFWPSFRERFGTPPEPGLLH